MLVVDSKQKNVGSSVRVINIENYFKPQKVGEVDWGTKKFSFLTDFQSSIPESKILPQGGKSTEFSRNHH